MQLGAHFPVREEDRLPEPCVSLASRVRPAEGILVTVAQDEAVILDSNSNHYYGLNKSGTQMWQAAMEADTLAAALDRLAGVYSVERERLKAGLLELISDLVSKGLAALQPSTPPTA